MDVLECPSDVTLQANSPLRRRAVHWPEPEFVARDGTTLEWSCTKKNGSEFATGSTKVDCFPAGMTAAGCSFIVSVVGTAQQSVVLITPSDLRVKNQNQCYKVTQLVSNESVSR